MIGSYTYFMGITSIYLIATAFDFHLRTEAGIAYLRDPNNWRLEDYGVNVNGSWIVDYTQQKYHCCGMYGYTDWEVRGLTKLVTEDPKDMVEIETTAEEPKFGNGDLSTYGNGPEYSDGESFTNGNAPEYADRESFTDGHGPKNSDDELFINGPEYVIDNKTYLVPDSCCINKTEGCAAGTLTMPMDQASQIIYVDGCMPKLIECLSRGTKYVFWTKIGFACLTFIIALLSCVISCSNDDFETVKAQQYQKMTV